LAQGSSFDGSVAPPARMKSVFAIFAVAAAKGAVELTTSNFDDMVFNSGKGAFIKFLAPW